VTSITMDGEPFRAARGLGNAHLQTVFAHLMRRGRTPRLERERWPTADGDVVDVDWLTAPPSAPHLMILHGLEGSSEAGYVRVLIAGAAARGWGVLAMNFRGCVAPNLGPRRYHAGDTDDARLCLGRLRERTSGPLGAVGFSLGGNVLCKLLAEDGEASPLAGAVTISTPFDLDACAVALDGARGLGAVYRLRFVRQLRQQALELGRRFPGKVDADRVRRSRGLREFDDVFTAPMHGFAGADDYYARASSAPLIARIRRPLLAINADDDPMVPVASLPHAAFAANPCTTLHVTHGGGHVGFVAGSVRAPRFWAEARALGALAPLLGAKMSAHADA
jgi:predicted alpha/beta-fold hydrolase